MKIKYFVLALFMTTLFMACSDSSDDSDGGQTDSFDRKALLENTADHIIIPALQDLDGKLDIMVSAKNAFVLDANPTTLENLRESWLNAYLTWQHVEMFNIGRAEEILYSFQMNVYPTNVMDIQNNIGNGNYDLTSPNNNDAVGFPAVDYLLYGTGTNDAEIISFYSNDFSASLNQQYLSDVVDQMKSLTTTVLNDWIGSYRDTFVNSTGNTASSSVNLLINDFIFYYEKGLRANKIGIPAGVFSTTPLADKVEAFYNQEVSKQLALEALTASRNFFNGRAYNGNQAGASYASYLTFLRNSNGTADLTTMINDQLEDSQTMMSTLDNNLFDQVNSDNVKMTQTYDELQRAVVLLKVDMLQTLNISVDYVDADGD